jgi:hypothetical protein
MAANPSLITPSTMKVTFILLTTGIFAWRDPHNSLASVYDERERENERVTTGNPALEDSPEKYKSTV